MTKILEQMDVVGNDPTEPVKVAVVQAEPSWYAVKAF